MVYVKAISKAADWRKMQLFFVTAPKTMF